MTLMLLVQYELPRCVGHTHALSAEIHIDAQTCVSLDVIVLELPQNDDY